MLINRNDSLSDVFANVSHELHRGALDRNHPFRFVNLATSNDQAVNARLVVLREIKDDLSFVLFTDSRSQKVKDLSENNNATLLLWHAGKKVQISIQGSIEVHCQDSLSEKYWTGISIEGRKAYGSKDAPGTIVERPDLAHDWPDEISNEFFSVLLFRPEEMDVLQLNKLAHFRAKFKYRNRDWSGAWLVP